MKIKSLKQQKGLSLIEVLTAFAIFGLLSVSIIAIFTASVNTQTVILQNQAVMNESNFVVDYMGRVIRLAVLDDASGSCTGTADNNYTPNNSSDSEIVFLAWDPEVTDLGGTCLKYRCRKFTLADDKILEYKSTDCTATNFPVNGTELTSDSVKVNELNFDVVGGLRSSTLQPKVTINLEMEATGRRIEPIPTIRVQTSLSQRNLNID